MTHDSAVRTVVSLVPEIEKRGAETVLAEYATREDLPVAQLEKLAQVYNTLRTVSHIDNAPDDARGSSVPLVDVPTLIIGYATGLDHEKAAAGTHSFSSHDVRIVDLNRALRYELGVEKAAAQVTGDSEQVNDLLKQAEDVEFTRDALLSLEVDLEDEMSKLASEIFSAAPRVGDSYFQRDISEFEEEALQHQPASVVKMAGEFMEKFAAPHRTKLVRFAYEQPVAKYAYDVGHAMGMKFAELAKAASTLEVVLKMAADATMRPPGKTEDDEITDAPPLPTSAKPLKSLNQEVGAPEKEDTAKKLNEIETNEAKNAPAEGGRAHEKDDDDRESRDSGSGKGKPSDPSKKDEGGNMGPSDLVSLLTVPVQATSQVIQDAAAGAKETLSGITSKPRLNKSQISADMSVEDIKRAMAIRRLIGTDPVLKEADPSAVLEAYNSIVARNPQLAGDMASIRLILREAVSYEGLTLDSQKLLSEIRRNSEQAEEIADKNEKSRYTVGGAGPLQLANKTK